MYHIIINNAAINPKTDLPPTTLLVLEDRIKARLKGLLAPIEVLLNAEGGTIIRDVAAATIVSEGFTPETTERIMTLLQENIMHSQSMPMNDTVSFSGG